VALLVFALFGSLQVAADQAARVEEYPVGCDAFGYLRMAKEIRAAPHRRWPQFRLRALQTQMLIDFWRSQSLPVSAWGELVAPHAHHYFPLTNEVGPQYPPGTGFALALFPESQAVYGLNRAFLWIFGSVGFLVLIVAGLRKAFVSAAIGILSLDLGLEVLARMGELSLSINAVLPPLLLATLFALIAAELSETRRLLASSAALAAGSLLGFATLIRLPTVLLAPGFLFLLWPSSFRKGLIGAPVLFAGGLAAFGLCPVLINQQHVAGAWYLPTYSAIDATPPDVRLIRQNLAFYFGDGPGAEDNWAVVAAAIGFIAAAVHTGGRTENRRHGLSWSRVGLASCLVWAVSLLFFLTHGMAIGYYMVPSVFVSVGLLGFGALGCELMGARRSAGGRSGARRIVTWILVACALAPGLMIVQRTWTRRAQTPRAVQSGPLFHQPVVLPADLASEHAWIWADLLSGTLYYYAGKPAFKIPFADMSTRLRAYRFVFERLDAQYVVRDSQAMVSLMEEIERMGGILQSRGKVDDYPYYQILWPKDGPTLPHQ
jgi:hypothetical protein